MRIIAGTARGRVLVAPAGDKTRPTQDYVRESLFNIIRWDIPEANVLDLFAGTGALALEALSRGADYATMVDMDRSACAAIKKNIQNTHMEDRCELLSIDYQSAINRLAQQGKKYNVVFIDPPYRMDNTGEMCEALFDKGLLQKDFLILVEHRRGHAPMLDERFEAFDLRKYGETEITFVRMAAENREEDSENDTVSRQL